MLMVTNSRRTDACEFPFYMFKVIVNEEKVNWPKEGF